MTSDITLANYAAQVPVMAGGNTPRAAMMARELRDIAVRRMRRSPRSVQRELGPSEVGHQCDRHVVGKMCGQPITNNVADPWPSIIGTAVHAWLADAFADENTSIKTLRWIPERRVRASPLAQHPGTADLYDGYSKSLIDHKVVGRTTMQKIMSPAGPPWYYVVQMLIYAQGYRDLGLPVERVILAAWPRTSPTLNDLYCWERPYEPARDDAILREVAVLTAARKEVARMVLAGQVPIERVRRTPSQECYFCPFYRPQSALDDGPGCPGHSERS